jgi:hypothetical protein
MTFTGALGSVAVGTLVGQPARMTDSSAVVWASFVPTLAAGTGSTGSFVGAAAALGFLAGGWEARVAASLNLTPYGCPGACVTGVGTVIDGALLYRPARARHRAGPFLGLAGGYAPDVRAPAVSGLAGLDLPLSRRVLIRLEIKYTEAFTGRYVSDVEDPVVRHGLRQVWLGLGLGFSGPFY